MAEATKKGTNKHDIKKEPTGLNACLDVYGEKK